MPHEGARDVRKGQSRAGCAERHHGAGRGKSEAMWLRDSEPFLQALKGGQLCRTVATAVGRSPTIIAPWRRDLTGEFPGQFQLDHAPQQTNQQVGGLRRWTGRDRASVGKSILPQSYGRSLTHRSCWRRDRAQDLGDERQPFSVARSLLVGKTFTARTRDAGGDITNQVARDQLGNGEFIFSSEYMLS